MQKVSHFVLEMSNSRVHQIWTEQLELNSSQTLLSNYFPPLVGRIGKNCALWFWTSILSASDEEISVKNPAFMMTAALTHACQMVELMAYYLDVNLPKRISYRYCEQFGR